MDADRLARIKAYTESLPTDASRVALEELLAELADVTQLTDRNNQLTWQVTDLAAEADRWRGQVAGLRSQLDGAQPSLAQASQQLIDHRTRLMSAEDERDQLRGLVQPVREENARLVNLIGETQAEVADLQVRNEGFQRFLQQQRAALEEVTEDRKRWAGIATERAQELDRALAREAVLRADADRLARWIVEHPTGPEDQRSDVLNLHDRTG